MRRASPIAFIALFCLSACGFEPSGLRPVPVDIKVPIPCHQELPAEPDWMMTVIPPDSDIADQVKAALVEIKQHEAYEDELRARMQACA